MKIPVRLFLLAISIAAFSGCKKPNAYPEIPDIGFKSLFSSKDASGKDTMAYVTITFTDGDGDLGHNPGDTLPPFNPGGPYDYDFVVKYFVRNTGNWQEVVPLIPFSGHLPYLTPEGSVKALKGEIQMKLFVDPFLTQDTTVRYEIFIYDRALHKSNTVTTAELTLHP